MNNFIRPTWDQTRIQMARAIAKRSLCVRAQVGAVITDTSNRIVGEGYNNPPAGYKHGAQPCNAWCKRVGSPTPSPDYSDCVTLHAEANALLMSDRSLRLGGTIYVTSHVCYRCAVLIANSGLERVVVDTDRADAHRDPLASYRFLVECGLQVCLNDLVLQARVYAGSECELSTPSTTLLELSCTSERQDGPSGTECISTGEADTQ